jgi:hypothetical protein
MKVYLAQLKCPNNHCVLALAGVFESLEEADLKAAMMQIVERRKKRQ